MTALVRERRSPLDGCEDTTREPWTPELRRTAEFARISGAKLTAVSVIDGVSRYSDISARCRVLAEGATVRTSGLVLAAIDGESCPRWISAERIVVTLAARPHQLSLFSPDPAPEGTR